MKRRHYDLIVLNGGSGGLSMAESLDRFSTRVAIIKGSSLAEFRANNSCIPKKLMRHPPGPLPSGILMRGTARVKVDC